MSYTTHQIAKARQALRDYAKETVNLNVADLGHPLDIEFQRGEVGGKAFVALQDVLIYLVEADRLGFEPSANVVAKQILRGLDAL